MLSTPSDEARRKSHDFAITREQAAALDPSILFYTTEYQGYSTVTRVLEPLDLADLSLAEIDFYCAPCLDDVRYRDATGAWCDITEGWRKLKGIRVRVLLALQLRPTSLDNADVGHMIGDDLYAVSPGAFEKTVSVLRGLLGGGGKNSRFIKTVTDRNNPAYKNRYRWNRERRFLWVSRDRLTLQDPPAAPRAK